MNPEFPASEFESLDTRSTIDIALADYHQLMATYRERPTRALKIQLEEEVRQLERLLNRKGLFPLGQIMITQAAQATLEEQPTTPWNSCCAIATATGV